MSELRCEDRGPVRVVTIDGEARMNVLSRALVAELAGEARRAAGDASVRAVVLTGAGSRAFCAGANLKERRGWTEDDVRRWLVELHAGLRELERCPKPWIAAVNGLALGGGCELALARSEEHTSELQSLAYLVCRLLLEKKKTTRNHARPSASMLRR